MWKNLQFLCSVICSKYWTNFLTCSTSTIIKLTTPNCVNKQKLCQSLKSVEIFTIFTNLKTLCNSVTEFILMEEWNWFGEYQYQE